MKEIKIWEISENDDGFNITKVEEINKTKTEEDLEEILTKKPELLMDDLKLVGRQTSASGGALDLLGVNADGKLVVFELKRGILSREAVAQIIDYGSFLYELDLEEISNHIAERSGNLGIDKIDDFFIWYQEQYSKNFEVHKPKMVLVGLGADDKTRRMVSFLAESDIDISLITFYGFMKDNKTLLAKQVEVEAKPSIKSTEYSKISNLDKLKERVKKLGIESFYYDMASFFRKQLPAYEWPNQGGFSYSLPELLDSGGQSNRVYIALYIHENQPGRAQIYIYPRAVKATRQAFNNLKEKLSGKIEMKNDGSAYIWVNSSEEWNDLRPDIETFCPEIVSGWKEKRELQSSKEFLATSDSSKSDQNDEG